MDTKLQSKIKPISAVFTAAVITAAVFAMLYDKGVFLPGWIKWEEKREIINGCELLLKERSLSFLKSDNTLWELDKSIKVQDFILSDIDNDGKDELTVLCFKRGKYGREKPFWIGKDERKWSQHIYIYEIEAEAVRPKWMASDIGMQVKRWKVLKICKAAFNESLRVGKSDTDVTKNVLLLEDINGNATLWEWSSWGLKITDSSVSIAAVGDNIIHEPIYRKAFEKENGSFDFLYSDIKNEIENYDIAVINQETPLVDKPDMYSDFPYFGTPSGVGKALKKAGFDIATCATNHMYDKKLYGINKTVEILNENGVIPLGIQSQKAADSEKPYELIVKNGIRLAFFDYTYGINGFEDGVLPDKEHPYAVNVLPPVVDIQGSAADADAIKTASPGKLTDALHKARDEADIVVFFVHWGTEYSNEIDEFQEHYVNLLTENDVDVIIGTHPHVLQPYEIRENESGHRTLIYYSLGNFISAQSEPERTVGGLAYFTVGYAFDGIEITGYGLKSVVTKRPEYSVYLLED